MQLIKYKNAVCLNGKHDATVNIRSLKRFSYTQLNGDTQASAYGQVHDLRVILDSMCS